MSKGNRGTRRKFLKTATVGSVSVPFVGTVAADREDEKRKKAESGFTLTASGSGSEEGETVSPKEKKRIHTLMNEIGEEDSSPTLEIERKHKTETIQILQEDPTEAPENEVWSDDPDATDSTITGATLIDADFYMTCYKPNIYDEDGNRYLMWYIWGGLRPQDNLSWTANLEEAWVELELTSDNGNMVRYKPGGDRNKHGTQMDMQVEVSGKPGGVGASATLSGSFTIGGGTVRPHRSKMDMDDNTFCPAFEGQTEATCELMGMCVGKRDPDGGTVTWDYDIHVSGDRYNKCPYVC